MKHKAKTREVYKKVMKMLWGNDVVDVMSYESLPWNALVYHRDGTVVMKIGGFRQYLKEVAKMLKKAGNMKEYEKVMKQLAELDKELMKAIKRRSMLYQEPFL